MGSGQKALSIREEELQEYIEREYEKETVTLPISTLKALIVVGKRASFSLDEFHEAKDAKAFLDAAKDLFYKADRDARRRAQERGLVVHAQSRNT